MKIMHEFTFHHLMRNKHHTLAIAIAITISSALLCSLCIFGHTIWRSNVEKTIEQLGDWHGELWDYTRGDKLDYIERCEEIESTMIKGDWKTAKLEGAKRDYLLMRDADSNFWNDMNLKNTLMEGRLPEKEGEIVVSKIFFLDNPSYGIGDTLVVPVGDRAYEGRIISPQEYKVEDEEFVQKKIENYTIVGMLDVSAVSAYPGYITMGYMNRASINAEDELTIYMRMKNPKLIYSVLPQIAEEVGLKKDEFGDYGVRYNTRLLSLYGINDSNQSSVQSVVIISLVILLALLVMGAFILVIYNAFTLSANSRIKQLGILKSLGATPNQIKYSVLFEGLILCIPLQLVGVVVGYLFSSIVVNNVNRVFKYTADYIDIKISFSWYVILFTVLMSLITVLISAYIPARKIAKVSPVEGIKQIQTKKKFKNKRSYSFIDRIFGIEGQLAMIQVSANRQSFRTSVISLAMCFILIAGYLNIIAIYNFADKKSGNQYMYDMSLYLDITYQPDEAMIQEIQSISEIQKSVMTRMVRTTTFLNESQQSKEFESAGGFESINSLQYNVLKRDGEYRIITGLIGMDDESFKTYCYNVGAIPADYYNHKDIKGILYDITYHRPTDSKDVVKIPMTKILAGDSIKLWERVEDDMETDKQFDITLGVVTASEPTDMDLNRYSTAIIVPMEVYMHIVDGFMSERLLESNKMTFDLLVGDEQSQGVKTKLTEISNKYLGSEDFRIWSSLEEANEKELAQKAIMISVISIAAMIGIIGVFNAFSTISNNLKLRRREFAMIRSIGQTPQGQSKQLLYEAIFFSVLPILISLPLIFIICGYTLNVMSITWNEFITFMPISQLTFYGLFIIMTIWYAYKKTANTLIDNNIVNVLKDETM